MKQTPTFKNPPIVEFVLGVQFAPLTRMTSAHHGRFWDFLGGDWGNPRDNPPIPDQFERFEGAAAADRRLHLKLEHGPVVNRVTFINQAENRLLQIQPTRFHLNWRKSDDFYPSYKSLIKEFEDMLARFTAFCDREAIGPIEMNQWEITYVDAFPRGEYWDTPADWGRFLPGLFNRDRPQPVAPLRLENRSVAWAMEIEPKLGRLHLQASLGRWKSEAAEALMLDLTARGPIGPASTTSYRDGLELGHDVAVEQFLHMVSEETKQRWGTANDRSS